MSSDVTASGAPGATTLGPRLAFAMAAAAGLAVANIYYNQPMLGVIEADFGSEAVAGWIPTATQLGYALSLLLVLPFGDVTDRRRVIVVQFLLLGGALILAALAPTAGVLVAASLLVGASATAAQQIVPFAAALATPARRGHAIGIVLGGILTGILLSRTLSGFVAAHWGWREMFWLGVPIAWLAAAMMAFALPPCPPQLAISYRGALASLAALWSRYPALRRASLIQALVFGAFSAFWTILALRLQEPPFGLGADAAGLFGILGAAGIFAAPMLGHVADRRGPDAVVAAVTLCVPAAWLVFLLWNQLWGIALGILVLDVGVQGALVANQHTILALEPAARSRLNTILMTCTFMGGAAGSAAASLAWSAGGWTAVCGIGVALGTAAVATRLLPSGRAAR